MACTLAGPAPAEFTSRMQVGNWSGGAWADNSTKAFRNCGLTLKLNGGTEFTLLVAPNFNPAFILIDQRIQAVPQQRYDATLKIDQGEEAKIPALGISQTMVQVAVPGFPNNYDKVRKAARLGFVVPGLTTTIDVTGMAQVLPRLFECVLAERGKLVLPASSAETVPEDMFEAGAAGVVAAEKSGVGPYIVFADKERPGNNLQNLASVSGFVGVQGPGGTANILLGSFWRPPSYGATTQEAKANLIARWREINKGPDIQVGDVPAIPGKPDSAGLFVIGNGVYEEFYLVRRKNGGHFQFSTSTPIAARKTAEAAGAKFRAAIAAVVP